VAAGAGSPGFFGADRNKEVAGGSSLYTPVAWARAGDSRNSILEHDDDVLQNRQHTCCIFLRLEPVAGVREQVNHETIVTGGKSVDDVVVPTLEQPEYFMRVAFAVGFNVAGFMVPDRYDPYQKGESDGKKRDASG